MMETKNSLERYKENGYFAPVINPVFMPSWKVFTDPKSDKTIFLFAGGRGSGKSSFTRTLLEYCLRGFTGHACRILILRTTKESAKKSIFKGVHDVVNKSIGDLSGKVLQSNLAKGELSVESGLYNDYNLGKLVHEVYVDSFSAEESTKEKLKGYVDISHCFIEELKELPQPDMYRQLLISIMRPYRDKQTGIFVRPKMIATFNTQSEQHWLTPEYYDLRDSQKEGFKILKPKTGLIVDKDGNPNQDGMRYEDRPVHYSFSTVYDNIAWKNEIIKYQGEKAYKLLMYEQYERFKEIDPYYYYTEIRGYVGSGRRGQVFTDWKEITKEEYDKIEAKPFYGLDFGFSVDPSTLVEVKHIPVEGRRDKLYVLPLIYEKGLIPSMLGGLIKEKVETFGYSEFYSDHRPEAIAELRMLGIQNIRQAQKGNDSRVYSVNYLKNYEVFFVDLEVIDENNKPKKVFSNEIKTYHWLIDRKTNMPINEPSDGNDHLIDALKYSVYTKLHPQSKSGLAEWSLSKDAGIIVL